MTKRVRSALAMRIVDLDRLKFNEAVANGQYPCAPATIKGSARIFDEDQLLGLYFFARLLDYRFPIELAGRFACQVASEAATSDGAISNRITFVKCEKGSFWTTSTVKYPATGETVKGFDHDGGARYGAGAVIFTVDFFIDNVRKIISDRIADEASILGEHDE